MRTEKLEAVALPQRRGDAETTLRTPRIALWGGLSACPVERSSTESSCPGWPGPVPQAFSPVQAGAARSPHLELALDRQAKTPAPQFCSVARTTRREQL